MKGKLYKPNEENSLLRRVRSQENMKQPDVYSIEYIWPSSIPES